MFLTTSKIQDKYYCLKRQKTILVAPLNWGLGHATRCMPIIDALLEQGAKVILASDGAALQLLQKEYPNLDYYSLPSYDIQYKGSNMFLNIAPQIPKILRAIQLERKMLGSIIEKEQIDVVLSDNRYGMHHSEVYSVFLTHQLHIPIPNKIVQKTVHRLNQQFMAKFDACWVPDWASANNLAGKLAHPATSPKVHYIGGLSRFGYQPATNLKYDVIAVLSGPEPQRTYLEQKIIAQAKSITNKNWLIVAGQTAQQEEQQIAPNIQRISYLTAQLLQQAIQESAVVLARSGYSTLMDLSALHCQKAILVPTPGQTEQEYLATHFEQKYGYLVQTQKDLNLAVALQQLETEKAAVFPVSEQKKGALLRIAIQELLAK